MTILRCYFWVENSQDYYLISYIVHNPKIGEKVRREIRITLVLCWSSLPHLLLSVVVARLSQNWWKDFLRLRLTVRRLRSFLWQTPCCFLFRLETVLIYKLYWIFGCVFIPLYFLYCIFIFSKEKTSVLIKLQHWRKKSKKIILNWQYCIYSVG